MLRPLFMKANICRKWDECGLCGAPGHTEATCGLRAHYHQQCLGVARAGKATEEEMREAMRPLNQDSQRVN